ncbi:MAG: O-acetyl-ADP-ribose deacetylase [Bacteroidota bacterium]
MNPKVTIEQGDITRLQVDAIVNAANSSLLGGGGVDGAIHRAAGPELVHACRLLGGCKTGDAKITPGFNLPAHYVTHTVGPVWQGGDHGEDELLKSCYQRSLEIAMEQGIETLAFPAISTGIYGFPMERATRIAVQTIDERVRPDSTIDQVILVAFDAADYEVMSRTSQITDE